jgi:serine/threonine protein kinase
MHIISYMAPEVALSQPYTETSDVYSFGILLWQICKLELPYEGITDEMVERKVVHCGFRPKIDPAWPNALRRLLQDCFASHPRRPHMDVVCNVLRSEIVQLSGKKLVDEDDMLDSARSVMSARHYN